LHRNETENANEDTKFDADQTGNEAIHHYDSLTNQPDTKKITDDGIITQETVVEHKESNPDNEQQS